MKRLLTLTSAVAASIFLLGAPSALAATPRCTDYIYAYGGSGTCVRYIQQMLNGVGDTIRYTGYVHIKEDGSFGKYTRAQAIAFQSFLNIQKDGKVGQHTWTGLCEEAYYAADNAFGDNQPVPTFYLTGHFAGCGKYVVDYDDIGH